MRTALQQLPWHWLPAALTLVMILYWHIDVPYHDQWDLLPLLQAKSEGTLTWQAMLAPHNGHILLLPRAIMLVLATLTHWNTLAEVLFSFGCILACWHILRIFTTQLLTRALSKPEQFCLALLVFSWAQAQNWLWGWQLQIPLALLCSLCGFASLLLLRNSFIAFVVALVFGVAASVSFAGCLPYWMAALPLLWQREKILLLPWLLFSAVGAAAYLQLLHNTAPTSFNTLSINTFAPLSLLSGSLLVLGNLVARYYTLVALLSALVMLFVIVIASATHSQTKAQRTIALSLLLFSVGSALLIAATRGGMGSQQMLASRYGTLTLPLLVVAFAALRSNTALWSKALSALLLVSCIASSVYSVKEFRQLHNRLQNGATALALLQTNPNDETGQKKLVAINPRTDQQKALQEVKLLQQYGLSFYRQ